MPINRELQAEILKKLDEADPDQASFENGLGNASAQDVYKELKYLHGHGLVTMRVEFYLDPGEGYAILSAGLTSDGADFIAKDGGLGAILKVVTVKLHEDTIRDLLIQRVTESSEDDTVKGKVIDQLKSLPAEGIRQLSEKVLDVGLRSLPSAAQWLQTILQST